MMGGLTQLGFRRAEHDTERLTGIQSSHVLCQMRIRGRKLTFLGDWVAKKGLPVVGGQDLAAPSRI